MKALVIFWKAVLLIWLPTYLVVHSGLIVSTFSPPVVVLPVGVQSSLFHEGVGEMLPADLPVVVPAHLTDSTVVDVGFGDDIIELRLSLRVRDFGSDEFVHVVRASWFAEVVKSEQTVSVGQPPLLTLDGIDPGDNLNRLLLSSDPLPCPGHGDL